MPLHPVRTTANTVAEHVADHNLYVAEFTTPTHTHSGAYVPAPILNGTVVQTAYRPQPITGTWRGANQGMFVRCVSPGTINTIRYRVTTQSGNLSVAAYRADGTNGIPGTRLATSGAFACPAAGDRSQALGASLAMNVGDWLYMSCDNTTAAFLMLSLFDVGDTFLAEGLCYRDPAGHPAPSPVPTVYASGYGVPWLVGVTV